MSARYKRQAHGYAMWSVSLAACILLCTSSFAQRDARGSQVTVVGCLTNTPTGLYLFATDDKSYLLTGDAAELGKFRNVPGVTVQGAPIGPPQSQPGTGGVYTEFRVDTIKQLDIRKTLSTSFLDFSNWRTETNPGYGIRFSHPANFAATSGEPEIGLGPNLVANDDTEALGGFEITADTYAGTTFTGGYFAAFANPKIGNRESCLQFRDSDPRFSSSQVIGDIPYSETELYSDGMGHGDGYHYFHTFQSGVCYELVIELSQLFGADDLACTRPTLTQQDDQKLIQPLMESVSFLPPRIAIAPAPPIAIPRITSFSSSSLTAGVPTENITLAWTSTDADYVRFSYLCSDVKIGHVGIIERNGGQRNCSNSDTTYPDGSYTFSPNSSLDLSLASYNDEDPRSVVITITPYARGAAYPDSSRSVTIEVDPYNQFPAGVPTLPRNLTVSYAPSMSGGSDYKQGSPLTIHWTDTWADPCVNLYLVQDTSSGNTVYLSQISGPCQKPSSSGSFTWTIPTRRSGSSFRIFASTPGGTSHALGPRFNIVQDQAPSTKW